jgi:hypothetical protein
MYSVAFRDMLLRGALQLRAREKSAYYFELGTKYAYLTQDLSLVNCLVRALTIRLQNLAERMIGTIQSTDSSQGIYFYALSVPEEASFILCLAASVELQLWRAGDSRSFRPAPNSLLPKELILL